MKKMWSKIMALVILINMLVIPVEVRAETDIANIRIENVKMPPKYKAYANGDTFSFSFDVINGYTLEESGCSYVISSFASNGGGGVNHSMFVSAYDADDDNKTPGFVLFNNDDVFYDIYCVQSGNTVTISTKVKTGGTYTRFSIDSIELTYSKGGRYQYNLGHYKYCLSDACASGVHSFTYQNLDNHRRYGCSGCEERYATIGIYRLYNPITGEHLYTTDTNEKDVLSNSYGWLYEGIAWYAPNGHFYGDYNEEYETCGEPVYRMYNSGLKNHLYTTDKNECNVLVAIDPENWHWDNNGNPVFYSGGEIDVYRVYNKELNGMHHLTTDRNEYETLPLYGWKQEGVALKAATID